MRMEFFGGKIRRANCCFSMLFKVPFFVFLLPPPPASNLFASESFRNAQDVHKIALSIKLRSPPPPGKSVSLQDFLLICTVFPSFGPFSGGGGVKPNFADKDFMDTQTFLNREDLMV